MRFICLFFINTLFAEPLLVGYYNIQAEYRPGAGACFPHNLLPITSKLSMILYELPLKEDSSPSELDNFQESFKELLQLREKNPSLIVIIDLKQPTSSSIKLIKELGAQGVNLNLANNCENLLDFLQEAKHHNLKVCLTLDQSYPFLKEASFDWIIIKNDSPETLQTLLASGIASDKIIISIPAYGISKHSGGGPGAPGYYTREPGHLAFYEIENSADFVTSETPSSMYAKGTWICQNNLGGGMIFPLDEDSFMDPIAPYALTESLYEGLHSGSV